MILFPGNLNLDTCVFINYIIYVRKDTRSLRSKCTQIYTFFGDFETLCSYGVNGMDPFGIAN